MVLFCLLFFCRKNGVHYKWNDETASLAHLTFLPFTHLGSGCLPAVVTFFAFWFLLSLYSNLLSLRISYRKKTYGWGEGMDLQTVLTFSRFVLQRVPAIDRACKRASELLGRGVLFDWYTTCLEGKGMGSRVLLHSLDRVGKWRGHYCMLVLGFTCLSGKAIYPMLILSVHKESRPYICLFVSLAQWVRCIIRP